MGTLTTMTKVENMETLYLGVAEYQFSDYSSVYPVCRVCYEHSYEEQGEDTDDDEDAPSDDQDHWVIKREKRI
jgi:hypothetical protein